MSEPTNSRRSSALQDLWAGRVSQDVADRAAAFRELLDERASSTDDQLPESEDAKGL